MYCSWWLIQYMRFRFHFNFVEKCCCKKTFVILSNIKIYIKSADCLHSRSCGLMDKASDFGSEDCRFESCHGLLIISWLYHESLIMKFNSLEFSACIIIINHFWKCANTSQSEVEHITWTSSNSEMQTKPLQSLT